MNLTTSCTILKFNNTSEILACASESEGNACKLVSLFPIEKNNWCHRNLLLFLPLTGARRILDSFLKFSSIPQKTGSSYLFRFLVE